MESLGKRLCAVCLFFVPWLSFHQRHEYEFSPLKTFRREFENFQAIRYTVQGLVGCWRSALPNALHTYNNGARAMAKSESQKQKPLCCGVKPRRVTHMSINQEEMYA
jgi:hypothetical protein